MIKRIAFFVEGHTEAEFVEAAIKEYATRHSFVIQKANRLGCNQIAYDIKPAITPEVSFYVLIVNCMNDDQVKSLIADHAEKLSERGYAIIVGIQDVYPKPLDKVLENLDKYLPRRYMPIVMVAGIMEVESWFIQNSAHYEKVDPLLNVDSIESTFSVDIKHATNIESIPHPADLLHRIYQTCGKKYDKSRESRRLVIEALDYSEIFLDKQNKSGSHNKFVEAIEAAFS